MSQAFRTARGGSVERWSPVRFTFDGKEMGGFSGDTLASALLANGVHLVGRSFKYHRPRGILTAGTEEPNALVRVTRAGGRETPNLRATQVELYDGLRAESQNNYPSLAFDLGGVAGLARRLLPAGFYYKTFMPSLGAWHRVFEPAIRRAAGLGFVPGRADPDHYANRYAYCDVLVVGGGPAGLAAARVAASSGARVILCDEQTRFGGSLLADTDARIEGLQAVDWVDDVLRDLRGSDRVTVLPRTTAFGYFADNFLALAERCADHLADPDPVQPRERLWQVRAKEVVLATGAIERPLVFAGNDRPGIMLADAARIYLNRYGVRAGSTAMVLTTHDSGYRAALDLQASGVRIVVIADARPGADAAWVERARAAGIRVALGTVAEGTAGYLRVHTVRTRHVETGRIETHSADLVMVAGGWTPSVHLFSQSRGRLRFDAALGCHVPDVSAQCERSAGGCRGVFHLAAVLQDGQQAGEMAARAAGASVQAGRRIQVTAAPGMTGSSVPPGDGPYAFVDFQNDVTVNDISLAVREGFRGVEHVKRYTTVGMATDQGKLSNINTLGVIARETGRSVAELGLTSFRQPYTPVTFGTLAGMSRGDLFDPLRITPMHALAAADGAVFEDVGSWRRALYFPRRGENRAAAVARECRTVRASVGIFDGSTLGKIEVTGRDAAEFLDRIYVNALRNLPVGKCRYAIMLTEAGFVMDDGIVARLSENKFHVTTTTGGAARVLGHMEDYRQTEWAALDVWLTSVTEQWAVIAVQGPRAREVLAPLMDVVGLPHMGVRDGIMRGVPTRLLRVSFTGELGYEVNIPADYAAATWTLLRDAAIAQGGCTYGTEAMHVLRAEKGFVIVGQETDGTVTPGDLGFSALGQAKRDFIGKRSLSLPDMREAERLQLVGLLPDRALEEGAQITAQPAPPAGTKALGHVTSAYYSPTLERPIALAVLADGRARHGEHLFVPMPDGAIQVRVVAPAFVDPEGKRLDG